MQSARDLAPIQARWAAATPGQWYWYDEVAAIPYNEAWMNATTVIPGNDGSLGVLGLFIEIPDGDLEPILAVNVLVADLGSARDGVDRRAWRGLIRVANRADLLCIAHAKADVLALIAEVERLRALVPLP